MFRKIFGFFKNKYIITILAFAIWMIAIDKNNMIAQYKLRKDLIDLRAKKIYYTKEIEKDKKEIYELNTNMKTLEKFAREKYLLKRDNEDIFLIVKE
ncbi:MAG: septum formation initiator family protein [Bacteroidetes bacterium]|nr:septum formation initiator family protein [Bacteroidota bacterium]